MGRDASLLEALQFAPLHHDDVPEARRLSDQAGWNQTDEDWHRLVRLEPGGTLGARHQGRLVGTATVVSYRRDPDRTGSRGDAGDVHWIGMVIVDDAYRGLGVGSAIFQRIMRLSTDRAPGCIGLDATDGGATVYRRHGFVPVHPIDRWAGRLRGTSGARAAERMEAGHLGSVLALDRHVLGLDRAALLGDLVHDSDVRGWVEEGEAGLEGYALLRPGRTHRHLGPVVATSDRAFAALLQAASFETGDAPVFMDALRDGATSSRLEARGMEVARRLTRMTYGATTEALMGEGVRLAVGFEWG